MLLSYAPRLLERFPLSLSHDLVVSRNLREEDDLLGTTLSDDPVQNNFMSHPFPSCMSSMTYLAFTATCIDFVDEPWIPVIS
jgi:hypothetical protein